MKFAGLTLITLLIVGSGAAGSGVAFGQTFTFGLSNSPDGPPACDYITFTIFNVSEAVGTHVLTTCGFPGEGFLVGLTGTIPASTGLPVTGEVVMLADSTFDAEFGGFTGCQLLLASRTKAAARHNPRFGWEFFYTCGGGAEYLGNWGYLVTFPKYSHKATGKMSSLGAVPRAPTT